MLAPSIIYVKYIYDQKSIATFDKSNFDNWIFFYDQIVNKKITITFSQFLYWNPLILINFLFLVNVDIGFWIIGLL